VTLEVYQAGDGARQLVAALTFSYYSQLQLVGVAAGSSDDEALLTHLFLGDVGDGQLLEAVAACSSSGTLQFAEAGRPRPFRCEGGGGLSVCECCVALAAASLAWPVRAPLQPMQLPVAARASLCAAGCPACPAAASVPRWAQELGGVDVLVSLPSSLTGIGSDRSQVLSALAAYRSKLRLETLLERLVAGKTGRRQLK
jgi:hypothetical protein